MALVKILSEFLFIFCFDNWIADATFITQEDSDGEGVEMHHEEQQQQHHMVPVQHAYLQQYGNQHTIVKVKVPRRKLAFILNCSFYNMVFTKLFRPLLPVWNILWHIGHVYRLTSLYAIDRDRKIWLAYNKYAFKKTKDDFKLEDRFYK